MKNLKLLRLYARKAQIMSRKDASENSGVLKKIDRQIRQYEG